jgi:hypothetical protein
MTQESNGTPLGWVTARGTTRLLVRRRSHQPAEGVVTYFDLAIAARR